ncbi:MAG: hypothetical protein K8R25_05020 [Methanosarcinales archaeon]|nr:hypothetical protein [Methanosarcinales archaeon]
MKSKKVKTKVMALTVCVVMLLGICGTITASTQVVDVDSDANANAAADFFMLPVSHKIVEPVPLTQQDNKIVPKTTTSTATIWTEVLDMDVLPDIVGWEKYTSGGSASVSGGILTIDTIGNDAYLQFDQRNPGSDWFDNVDNSKGWVVEARLQVDDMTEDDAYLVIWTHDRTWLTQLRIYKDYISWYPGHTLYYMDTTDTYHIYRIEGKGNSYKVYVNGNLAIDGVVTSGGGTFTISFGDGHGGTQTKSYWDYFRYSTVGEEPPPDVSVSTDSFEYCPGDMMTVTMDIANPTEDSVMFQCYWGVPQYSIWVPVMSIPIPAGYNETHNFSFIIPDLGPTPFGNVFYVQLLNTSDVVLDADAACWAYSPGGEAMSAAKVNIAKEIKKTIKRIE